MKIEKQFIPGLIQSPLKTKSYVVAHESGNPNNTGPNSLENEVKFMTNNWQNAFVAYWVGSGGRIIQIAQAGKVQYGAGYKANPHCYAHVELARTNNKERFKKDYEAYVWLLRKLAKEAGIPLTFDTSGRGIKSHDWIRKNLGGTTHTDPFGYLAEFGITKAQLKKDIEGGGEVTAQPSKPKGNKPSNKAESSKTNWTKVTGNWTGQTLKNGQYGEPVRQLQTKLANNKPPFYPDKNAKNNGVDSYYGNDTENAVRRFQSYYGLGYDGLAGKEVYGKLNGNKSSGKSSATKKSKYPLPSGVLKRGSKGNKVKQLQRALNAAKFKVGKVDGDYGGKTEDAVRRFQLVHDPHHADGDYGPRTKTRLDKVVN